MQTTPPDDLWSELSPELPVALFPVRLETRFAKRAADNVDVLRVRIYPDELTISESNPTLTEAELAAASGFWAIHKEQEANPEVSDRIREQRRAWERVVRSMGLQRALFAARATQPGATASPPPSQADTAPRARLLPDAWLIVGERAGQPSISTLISPVEADLPVGPELKRNQKNLFADLADPNPVKDTDPTFWLYDFETAVKKGMAAEIELTAEIASAGFDALYVLGIRLTTKERSAQDEAQALHELLASQTLRERAAFLAPGTATNNAADQSSGYTSTQDIFGALDRLVGFSPPALGTPSSVPVLQGGGSNFRNLAVALGFNGSILQLMPGSNELEQWFARQMQLALFPVTLGEALAVMAQPVIPGPNTFDEATRLLDEVLPFVSEHAAAFVRARGPLPTLRVGRQPYGILPILPLGAYRVHAEEPPLLAALADLLNTLRHFWEHAAQRITRIDGKAGAQDTTAALLKILGLGPVPHAGRYGVEQVIGPLLSGLRILKNQSVYAKAPADYARRAAQHITRRLVRSTLAQLPANTLFERIDYQGQDSLRVQVALSDAERQFTPQDYLRGLCGRAPFDPNAFGARKPDVLYQVVERSIELAKELGQIEVLQRFGSKAARFQRTTPPELRFTLLARGNTIARQAEKPLNELLEPGNLVLDPFSQESVTALFAKRERVEEFMSAAKAAGLPLPKSFLTGYFSTLDAVSALADVAVSDAELTRLFGETLAVCTTRLDAWCTSLAMRRLATLRGPAEKGGLQLGFWGLLVDVRRSGATVEPNPPLGWPPQNLAAAPPLHVPSRQVGYVHAPSLQHAVMGGVLRAAELSHAKDATLGAIDLTSRRVRRARDVIDCVRNGQPLGVVLGCQVERALSEVGAHASITALRSIYPQHRDDTTAEGAAAIDAVAPAEVLDGAALYHAVLEAVLAQVAAIGAAEANETERLRVVLLDLHECMDGLADVLVAEGTYNIVSGHPEQAAAVFDAAAHGGDLPATLHAVTPPQSGVSLTHRVLLVLDKAHGTAGWQTERARALLSPQLEGWVQTQLGAADSWLVSTSLKLDALELCALDVVAEASMSTKPGSATASSAAESVLAQRIRALGPEPGAQFERLVAHATAIGELLAGARTALAADLTAPKEASNDQRSVLTAARPRSELKTIADALTRVLGDLDKAVTESKKEDPNPDKLKILSELSLLSTKLDLGLKPAASAALGLLADVDQILRDALPAQAKLDPAAVASLEALSKETVSHEARVRAIAAMCGLTQSNQSLSGPLGAVTTLTTLLRRLGGPALLPSVKSRSELSNATVPDSALPQVKLNQDHEPSRDRVRLATIERWLDQYGRVRPQIARFDDLRLFAAARSIRPDPLSLVQLPRDNADEWLGGPLPKNGKKNKLRTFRRPDGPRTHVVCAGTLSADASAHALVLDEFHEVLPSETATTGLALHYDGPNARPPQSILLAVHPDPSKPWSWHLLIDTLREALTLTRIRAVDLEQLQATALDDALPLAFVRGNITNNKEVPAEIRDTFEAANRQKQVVLP